jgi:hypothetical protein
LMKPVCVRFAYSLADWLASPASGSVCYPRIDPSTVEPRDEFP